MEVLPVPQRYSVLCRPGVEHFVSESCGQSKWWRDPFSTSSQITDPGLGDDRHTKAFLD